MVGTLHYITINNKTLPQENSGKRLGESPPLSRCDHAIKACGEWHAFHDKTHAKIQIKFQTLNNDNEK